jgi:hypothetical protein
MVREQVHPKHPKKEVNEALDYADRLGLLVERTSAGHKWGRVVCSEGEWVAVWSTPRSPFDHGRRLRKWADQHVHVAGREAVSDARVEFPVGFQRRRVV